MTKELTPSLEYNSISNTLSKLELSDRLLIISNLLFDCYSEARKCDVLYNKIDKPPLENIEDYAYMKELYNFEETSYVYIILDRAHDLLRASLNLDKVKYGN